MKILDLFCGAGGASEGYARAGFEVCGVDNKPQKNYPFKFKLANVFDLSIDYLREFDAIHASPPCQGYSAMRHAPGAVGAPKLISETRKLLRMVGLPYIIENVEQARDDMVNPLLLCGTMFALGAQGCELQRHRLFETSWVLEGIPDCDHSGGPVIGVYGGHARNRSACYGGRGTKDVWEGGHRAAASTAMRISWMTLAELSDAIPPVYTQWIGLHLKDYLNG